MQDPDSETESSEETAELNDINQKFQIARNVVAFCFVQTNFTQNEQNAKLEQKLHHLTNLNPIAIEYYYKLYNEEKRITFKEFIDSHKPEAIYGTTSHYLSYVYMRIRTIILKNYIETCTILTKKSFTLTTDPSLDQVRYAGFIWKLFPGTTKCILREDPVKVFNRMNYLKKIKNLRNDGRPIVYIDDITICDYFIERKNADDPNKVYIAASPSGLLDVVHVTRNNETMRFDTWLEVNILPLLSCSTVIVLRSSSFQITDRVPTEFSSKAEMTKWLELNGVPHDPKSHRSDLYTLIVKKQHTFTNEYERIDNILKGWGHEVLRYPKELLALNYYTDMWEEVFKWKHKRLASIMGVAVARITTMGNWKKFEEGLINRENKIYEDDMKIEDFIEKLEIAHKNGDTSFLRLCEDYPVQLIDVYSDYFCL